jgi:integrase
LQWGDIRDGLISVCHNYQDLEGVKAPKCGSSRVVPFPDHGLRHTYITLGRLAGIADMEIQALTGHRSGVMMERYSHVSQVLDFAAAREKLEKALNI